MGNVNILINGLSLVEKMEIEEFMKKFTMHDVYFQDASSVSDMQIYGNNVIEDYCEDVERSLRNIKDDMEMLYNDIGLERKDLKDVYPLLGDLTDRVEALQKSICINFPSPVL